MVTPSPSSSNGGATVGYSLKSEIVERACEGLTSSTDTEMMWNFFKKLKGLKTKTLSRSKFDCNARLTLDYPEDYIFLESIRLILGNLTSRKNIYNLLKKNPNLIKINYFRNKEWKNNQNKKYN